MSAPIQIVDEENQPFPTLPSPSDELVYLLPYGSHYKVRLMNPFSKKRCVADLKIDGYDMGHFVLEAGRNNCFIERPENEDKKFTLLRTGVVKMAEEARRLLSEGRKASELTEAQSRALRLAPSENGIESGRSENGLVEVSYVPELVVVPAAVVAKGRDEPVFIQGGGGRSAAAATTLLGKSEQKFSSISFKRDPKAAPVVVYARLVCDADEDLDAAVSRIDLTSEPTSLKLAASKPPPPAEEL